MTGWGQLFQITAFIETLLKSILSPEPQILTPKQENMVGKSPFQQKGIERRGQAHTGGPFCPFTHKTYDANYKYLQYTATELLTKLSIITHYCTVLCFYCCFPYLKSVNMHSIVCMYVFSFCFR